MKNFLIAVIIAVLIASSVGAVAEDWWGLHWVIADEVLNPWEAFVAFSIVAVVFVFVGFIVAMSIAGEVVIGVVAGGFALFITGIIALWPLLLLVALVYLIRRKSPSYAT
ncbi:hypothetical protein CA267_012955 [Alteromonas pelagimontana]|uniref:Uncharacterized protein n=1 Tax=Alteromonas pelagimontana TaxID=1858656 RepID=A0A6M4MET3_9ALTE|nr:hypothetical protein [Alteromonas pelagimontana]QJR81612.1 hypothetical protein CA267_012955 [Alteromonas pelagimontana]